MKHKLITLGEYIMEYSHPTKRKSIIRPYTFLEICELIDAINSRDGFQHLMDVIYPEKRHLTPSQQVTIGDRVAEKYDSMDASGT